MCDTAVVVSRDGVLFAKNSDRDPNEAQVLDWRPRARHPRDARVRCTWLSIPEVEETNAVLLSRPFWMWGAEIGANEHDVVIGNEAVFTRDPVPEVGLTGMDLLRLALERASTARAAVETIVDLAERHGQGGRCGHEVAGFRYFSSFIVADRTSAFVLETAGRSFAVEEVSGARSISNGLTIGEFARAHSEPARTFACASHVRRRTTEDAARRAGDVSDMFAMLREHRGPEPDYSLLTGAMSAPCMHGGGLVASSQTVASWVSNVTASQHWATGTAAPCTSLFKPVAVNDPLDLGPAPTDRADERSLFWRHERFHRAVLGDPSRLSLGFAAERDEVERRWLRDRPTPRAAFDEGDALLLRWSRRVREERAPDRRPAAARHYWRVRDQRAGLR